MTIGANNFVQVSWADNPNTFHPVTFNTSNIIDDRVAPIRPQYSTRERFKLFFICSREINPYYVDHMSRKLLDKYLSYIDIEINISENTEDRNLYLPIINWVCYTIPFASRIKIVTYQNNKEALESSNLLIIFPLDKNGNLSRYSKNNIQVGNCINQAKRNNIPIHYIFEKCEDYEDEKVVL